MLKKIIKGFVLGFVSQVETFLFGNPNKLLKGIGEGLREGKIRNRNQIRVTKICKCEHCLKTYESCFRIKFINKNSNLAPIFVCELCRCTCLVGRFKYV